MLYAFDRGSYLSGGDWEVRVLAGGGIFVERLTHGKLRLT